LNRIIDLEQISGSIKTIKYYKFVVNELFYKHTGIKDNKEFLALADLEMEERIYDYVDLLKHKVRCTEKSKNWKESPISPNSFPNYLKPIRKILDINGRENSVRWKMIYSTLPNKEASAGYKAYSKEDVAKMIEFSLDLRSKALVLFLASTGARKGIFDLELGHQLLLRHLVPLQYKESKCYAVLLYASEDITVEERMERESGDSVSGAEYWGFLTPEATAALDRYLEWRKEKGDTLDQESPIFCAYKLRTRSHHTLNPLSESSVYQIIERVLERAKIKRIKKRNHYDIQTVHGLRKLFNHALKMTDKMNTEIAEKLMAHSNGLKGVYDRPTREECFVEFCKAIPDLTINESVKKQMQLDKAHDENVKLRTENAENRLLKREMVEVKATMAEIKAEKNDVEVERSESVGFGSEMARELMKDPAMRKEIMKDLFKDEAIKNDLLQLIRQSLSG